MSIGDYQATFGYFKHNHLKEEKFINNTHACWSMVSSIIGDYLIVKKEIYISNYDRTKTIFTEERLTRLIELINKITPCEIVELSNVRYIKFTLLKTYNQSILLLNFIRNLWYSQSDSYHKIFFELIADRKKEDALSKLMRANKEASINISHRDHSNVISNEPTFSYITNKQLTKAKIRTKKELYKFEGVHLDDFLKE